MSVSLPISRLFELAFGYKTDAFDPTFAPVPERVNEGAFAAPYWGVAATGQEYYLPVQVNVGSDNAEALGLRNADGSLTSVWDLPYPVVSVSQAAYIIDTQLTERRGVVSEYINTGGWQITVRGLLIGKGQNFPEQDYRTLMKLFEIGKPIRIKSVVTDHLLLSKEREGSDEVIVRRVECPGVPGVPSVRAYTLELTSNEPFNLIYKQ